MSVPRSLCPQQGQMAQGQLPGVLGWWLGWWQSWPAQLWARGQGTAPAKSPVGSAQEVI